MSAEAPTKVCPNCSVLSQTDADRCPSCGASYARGPGRRGRAGAVAAGVGSALAAAAAVVVLSGGDDEPALPQARATPMPTPPPTATAVPQGRNAITLAQAKKIQLGSTVNGVRSRLGEPKPDREPGEPARFNGLPCVYYNLAGTPEGDVRLCYRRGRLATGTTVYPAPGEAPADDPPASQVTP